MPACLHLLNMNITASGAVHAVPIREKAAWLRQPRCPHAAHTALSSCTHTATHRRGIPPYGGWLVTYKLGGGGGGLTHYLTHDCILPHLCPLTCHLSAMPHTAFLPSFAVCPSFISTHFATLDSLWILFLKLTEARTTTTRPSIVEQKETSGSYTYVEADKLARDR